jgi:hypothetical protein
MSSSWRSEPAQSAKDTSAAAELEWARTEEAEVREEFGRLFRYGTELREAGATLEDIAPINERLRELGFRSRLLGDRIRHLELAAENERHGWTTQEDGSVAKIDANGEVQSVQSSVSEWTDSDGAVYRETPEDRRHRAEEHKATVLAFKAGVTKQRLACAPTRRAAAPVVRVRRDRLRSSRPPAYFPKHARRPV